MKDSENKNIIIGVVVDNSKMDGSFSHATVIFHSEKRLSDDEKAYIIDLFNNTFHFRMQMALEEEEDDFSVHSAIYDVASIIAGNKLSYQILEADCCAFLIASRKKPMGSIPPKK